MNSYLTSFLFITHIFSQERAIRWQKRPLQLCTFNIIKLIAKYLLLIFGHYHHPTIQQNQLPTTIFFWVPSILYPSIRTHNHDVYQGAAHTKRQWGKAANIGDAIIITRVFHLSLEVNIYLCLCQSVSLWWCVVVVECWML